MRRSSDEKARTRARIVAAAARRLRADGTQGVSVAEIMGDAGLTHGGFYRHFPTREALIHAALDASFTDLLEGLGARLAEVPVAARAGAFRAAYLDAEHVAHPEAGCPMAAAGQDVARGGAEVRAIATAGVSRMLALLATGTLPPSDAAGTADVRTTTVHDAEATDGGSAARGRRAAMRDLAMLVGAVVLARASDPALAHEILDACRDAPLSDP